LYYISYKDIGCCFVATGKSFRKNLGMGEWAPPFPILSSPTPPPTTGQNDADGGGESGIDGLFRL
jgi:hypothetical protein